jgi:hypothetical protein
MARARYNNTWAGLLSLAIVAAAAHTPIVKVRLADLSAEALRSARAIPQTGSQGKRTDPGKTDSPKRVVIGSSCDTWDRTLRSASARAATNPAVVRTSAVTPVVTVRPVLEVAPVKRPLTASASRAASNPERPHAPPAVA